MTDCSKSIKKYKSTRNPFLNFIKAERMCGRFKNMDAIEAAKAAGAKWRQMSKDDKRKFEKEAIETPHNVQVPVFFRLKEHQLGTVCRQHLYLFKAAVNGYVEGCVAQLKAVESESGCRKC
jgi:HMG-box domain